MNSFGEYLRDKREQLGLPLRKVAAELDIDTSILSKIERGERTATKEMLPVLANTLNIQQREKTERGTLTHIDIKALVDPSPNKQAPTP